MMFLSPVLPDGSGGTDVAQVDEIEPANRARRAGRDQIDQIERDPLPFGHTSRRCAVGLKLPDGAVVVEPDPWAD
jgi:hypothetical protein